MPPPNEPSQLLRHVIADCTGSWQPTEITGVWFWHCAVCRAIHWDELWVREAARYEVELGEQLQELEREGWRLRGTDSSA